MSENAKALWCGDRAIQLTDRYKAALIELAEAEIDMMRKSPGMDTESWTWGEVRVGDLASASSLEIIFGGDEDKPKDLDTLSRVVVI